MEHDFDFGQTGKSYNPGDYGLPVWRDEDHFPPQETAEAKQEPEVFKNMTAEEAKRKLCLWAESQLGYREGANNWQKYAESAELQAMYGWKPQNQPWCDVFVDSGFIACFGLENACAMTYQSLGEGSALCRQSAQYYKENGAWATRPEIGDQIFFYSAGDINHTGIVVGVDGGSVTTVEGNSADMVAERVYSVSDSKIAGYGRPNWAAVNLEGIKDYGVGVDPGQSGVVGEQRTYTLSMPYLRRGDTGPAVIAAQFQLAGQGYYIGPDGADGDFGGNTEQAVKAFQRAVGVSDDSVIGPDTGAALFGGEVYIPPTATLEVKEEPKADSFWNNLLTKIRR